MTRYHLKLIVMPVCLLALFLIQGGASWADARRDHINRQLYYACENGDSDNVIKLITKGANVDGNSAGGRSPICAAVQENHPGIVSELIRRGAKVDTLDYRKWTPLLLAIDGEYFDIVNVLLASGANPNYAEPRFGITPVYRTKRLIGSHRDNDAQRLEAAEQALALLERSGAHETLFDAARLGDVETAEKLLINGAVVDQRDCAGATPLMYACKLEDPAVLNLLLKHGANPNARDHAGKTVLMYTADYRDFGDFQGPEILIRHGARVDDQDKERKTALMLSTYASGSAVTTTLLRYRANSRLHDKNGMTALMHAADWGMHAEWTGVGPYGKAVAYLLKSGADRNARDNLGRTALLIAASRWGATSTVIELLAAGSDPNLQDKEGATPLMWALERDNTEEIDLLRKAGARTGLFESILINDAHSALSDIAKDANVNIRGPYGLTPLMLAARQANRSLCESLLAAGARVDVQDEFGITPLHIAVGADGGGWDMRHSAYNHQAYFSGGPSTQPRTTDAPDLVELLISAGADIEARDKRGATPLMWAAVWSFSEDVRVLLSHGACVQGRIGSACIEDAIGRDAFSMLDLLLNYGADPNAADFRGTPLLIFASEQYHDAIVGRLVRSGVNVNRRARDGSTALMAAVDRGETAVVRRLLAAGADRTLRDFSDRLAIDYVDSRWPEIRQLLKTPERPAQ